VLGLGVLAVLPGQGRTASPEVAAPAGAGLATRPADFIENRGQWSAKTRFVAWKNDLAAALSRDAIRLSRAAGPALTLRFAGAAQATLVGERRRPGRYNFIFGSDPAHWRTGVSAYRSVRYRGLYPGIDLRVREGRDQLEYDVLAAPGAELRRVVVRAGGARSLAIARDGSLLLHTARGTLRQARPVAWDVTSNGRHPLESRFVLLGAKRYGFIVVGHDPRLPLVVDPGLDWATFLGGSGDESITGLERVPGASGDIVVAGQTQSPDFPRTGGNLAPVGWTPYVARLSADGARLVYSTFFGGTANHSVQDVGLDSAGRPAVVGDTTSLDFPTTAGAYDLTPGNGFQGDYDAYVIKFEADGSGPVFGTYLGGAPNAGTDQAWNVLFDSTDSPIVSGWTNSASFPTTTGAYDRAIGGQDLFISRFSPDGSQLTYSTFFGGDGVEEVFDMVIDPQGVLTLTGKISQFADQLQPLPTTADAFDRTFDGGGSTPGTDGYVMRLKPDGAGAADLKYSTFLGGAQYKEAVTGVALDPNDSTSVTVAGWTYSGDFPTTAGALQRTHFAPIETSMVFVSRFRFPAAGSGSLVWSTLYGAPGNQGADDVTVDSAGRPVVVGATAANNPPTTERSFDRIPGIGAGFGDADGFVARLSADGTQNEYMTLLGGGDVDEIVQNVVYAEGNSVVVAGLTNAPDFPVTPGAYDTVYAADGFPSDRSAPGSTADDAFVARLTLEAGFGDVTAPPAPTLKGPATGSTYTAHVMGVTFDWTDVADPSGIAAYHIQLSPNPEFNNTFQAELDGWYEVWLPSSVDVKGFSVSDTGTYSWRVQALDGAGNLGPWSATRAITVQSPTPPDAPVLVSPPNLGRFAPGNIVLDWNPAARAKFYELQVDTTSSFSNANKLWVRGLTATRFTASLTSEGKRWWRVRASNDSFTDGPWSTVRSFELRTGSPPAPVPPPDNDGGGTPPSPSGEATAVAKLSPDELPLSGGGSGQLTVHLNGVAPLGGAVVALASRYSAVASVPPTVTVPGGQSSATFTVTAPAGRVQLRQTIVTAEYNETAAQGILLTVFADKSSPDLYTLVVNGVSGGTTTFLGGQTVQATVAFIPGWTAPPGGAVVALGSSNPALATVPDRVVIPAGANSTTFTVITQAVPEVKKVTILAARSQTHRVELELLAPGSLSTLSLNPSTVVGGNSSTGTVTLASAAPAGGVTVALSSHDTTVATVPASVTVPAGSSSATFNIATTAVSGESKWSIIKASAGGVERQQTINTTAPPTPVPGALSSLTLTPSTVVGGQTSTGRATLGLAAPSGGIVVSLFSNSAAASVPASVTIPAGATSATFTVSTTPITGLNQTAQIVAGTSNSSREAFLTITPAPDPPPAATLSAVSLSPTSVTGGTPSTGTVILTGGAPTGGLVISLSSSNTAAATVPASVTVPAGASSATFTVTTLSGTTDRSSIISATAGADTRTATLTVTAGAAPPPPAPTLSTLTLSPATVTGGNPSTGIVTLTSAAPAGGSVVSLSSGNTAAATVPASITVPAGATSASFTITTISGTTNRSSVISATGGGVTRTATLTVNGTAVADTVTITRAEWSSGRLRVEATSTSSTATLRVYVTSTDTLIGTLTNDGGGRYRGDLAWATNPGSITVKSSLGGSATRTL
jgi:hypothetical protein